MISVGRRVGNRSAAATMLALTWCVLFASLISSANATKASDNADVLGQWLTEKRKLVVELYDCDDRLCGRIAWLKKARDKTGALKRDVHNPDPELRDRGWCGIDVVKGLEPEEDGRWGDGEIYNPKDGRRYSMQLKPNSDGSMHVRAYIGTPLLGRSETWTRPETPPPDCDTDS